MVLIVLVVRFVLLAQSDVLFVLRDLDVATHLHNDGFIHLVGDDRSLHGFFVDCFCHTIIQKLVYLHGVGKARSRSEQCSCGSSAPLSHS